MAFAYGLELCYKLVSRQFVYALNPCHVLCLVQLIILCASPYSPWVQTLFKLLLNLMYLPITACVLPVTNTLFLPGELFTYWFEHALLLVIPLYLLMIERTLRCENLTTLRYTLLAYGAFGIYNFAFLHPVSLVTMANVNLILCPGITDPFSGPNYRLHALWHQFVFALIGGKIFWVMGKTAEKLGRKEKQN